MVCIAIHTNIYQHVLACIWLVFGMNELIIHANTDQIHACFFNMCQCRLQYIHQYKPNTIQYRPNQAQIQVNTRTNTDQYTQHCFQYLHQYMPIQASVLSNQAPQPAPPMQPAQPASLANCVSWVFVPPKQYTSAAAESTTSSCLLSDS